jgi:hypothetical protein
MSTSSDLSGERTDGGRRCLYISCPQRGASVALTKCQACGNNTYAQQGRDAQGAAPEAIGLAANAVTQRSIPVPDRQYGKAKFVGDAQPIGGMPLSRVVNALVYMIAGIAGLVVSGQPNAGGAKVGLVGAAAMAYGLYILFTKGSYWVSSVVYVVALFAVFGAFASTGS